MTVYEPQSYSEAISYENSELWKNAISKEIDILECNHTWDIVSHPKDTNIIKCKWVFKVEHRVNRTIE